MALGLGAVAVVDAGTHSASAASFTVTPEQLQINQNISSAAVRRSNRSLNYLAPIRTPQTDSADDGNSGVKPLSTIPGSGAGWAVGQLAPGQKQLWANIGAAGALTTSSGPATGTGAFTATRSAAGNYVVDFKTNVSGCSWNTSPVFAAPPGAPLVGVAVAVPNQPTQVNVRIFDTIGAATPTDSNFTVQVLC
jgi:hypothetical protein